MLAAISYILHWGKTDKNDALKWRPFIEHTAAVVAVASMLLTHRPLLIRNIQRQTGWSESEIRAVVGFLAASHDIGKLSVLFQRFRPDLCPYNSPLKSVPANWASFKHGVHGPDVLAAHLNAAKEKELLVAWKQWEPLIRAAAGHHGFLIESDPPYMLETITFDRAPILDFWRDLWAYFSTQLPSTMPNGPQLGHLRVLMAGIISTADWVGSQEDPFCLREKWDPRSLVEVLEDPEMFEQANQALDKSLRALPPPKVVADIWADVFKFAPTEFQEFVQSLSEALLVVIEAPTGDGKSEAALALFYHLLIKGHVDKLVWALHTRSAAESMSRRITKFSKELWDSNTSALYWHGSAALEQKFASLYAGKNQATTQPPSWFLQRKRSMLYDLVSTTTDQVMLSSLQGSKHYFVRAMGLSTACVVIDEVHACDLYMKGVLKTTIRNLLSLGARVVLMSATLSPNQRRDLLMECQSAVRAQSDSIPQVKGFPVVSWMNADGKVEQRAVKGRRQSVEKKIKIVRHRVSGQQAHLEDETTMARSILESYRAGGCVGWIRNFVEDAQRIARLLLEMDPNIRKDLILLHAGAHDYDRLDLYEELKRRLGPDSKVRSPTIVIATPVLQESHDVDFDRLIRDFCCWDDLLQALGRLHRHAFRDPQRPPELSEPVVEVFMPETEKGLSMLKTINAGRILPLLRSYEDLGKKDGCSFMDPSDVPAIIAQIYDTPPDAENLKQAYERDKKHQFNLEIKSKVATLDFQNPSCLDSGRNPRTRLGSFNLELLVLDDLKGNKLCIPGRPDLVLDLNPFKAALDSGADLKFLWYKWLNVLKHIHYGQASRSRFRSGDTVKSVVRHPSAVLLTELMERFDLDPAPVVLVQPTWETGVLITRTRVWEGQEKTATYSLSYRPDGVGLFIE